MIQAIETRYAGCRFRSRLEARWAVFFDTLGIKWEYEPEGILVPMGECGAAGHVGCGYQADPPTTECVSVQKPYLPDFWLPQMRTYVEVKGSDEQVTPEYKEMLAMAIDYHATVLSEHGLLLLGPVPDVSSATSTFHHQLYWRKGIACQSVQFAKRWHKRDDEEGFYGWGLWSDFPIGLSGDGETASGPDFPRHVSWEAISIHIEVVGDRSWWAMPQELHDAYVAARSARFEHGESG